MQAACERPAGNKSIAGRAWLVIFGCGSLSAVHSA